MRPVWKTEISSHGIGGIAATNQYVVIGSRNPSDEADLFECYRAQDGELVWGELSQAVGSLDYGNSPRATPLICDGFVYVVSAFGEVQAFDIEVGAKIWSQHLVNDLGGIRPSWGYSASPIMIDNQLFLQPGGKECATAGLDSLSGEVIWTAPGEEAVYASIILQDKTPQRSLVGMDARGICGMSEIGEVLWRRSPNVRGDFGVPTPLITRRGLVATSENNGTRLFAWPPNNLEPSVAPEAVYNRASPNSHTPVAIGDRLLVADSHLNCLDLANHLELLWQVKDRDLRGYVSLIATEERVLAVTENGTLMLFDIQSGKVLGKLKLTEQPIRLLSHPAIVGTMLFVRVDQTLMCLDLAE